MLPRNTIFTQVFDVLGIRSAFQNIEKKISCITLVKSVLEKFEMSLNYKVTQKAMHVFNLEFEALKIAEISREANQLPELASSDQINF